MTKQEAYERIRAYFSREGAVLAKDEFGCYYRMGAVATGDACAVGCLIPDEKYTYRMEQRGVEVVYAKCPELKPLDDFLRRAQHKHDSSTEVSTFIKELDALADAEGLEVVA